MQYPARVTAFDLDEKKEWTAICRVTDAGLAVFPDGGCSSRPILWSTLGEPVYRKKEGHRVRRLRTVRTRRSGRFQRGKACWLPPVDGNCGTAGRCVGESSVKLAGGAEPAYAELGG